MKKLYGLIGFPLGHSKSVEFFTNKFREAGLTGYSYRLFPLPDIADLLPMIDQLPDLRGFNVTIPYKEKIVPFLAEMDEEAQKAGCANVVLLNREQGQCRMTGYNTDAPAFLDSLTGLERHHHALILGTGGVSKAVASTFDKLNIDYLFVSRNPTNTKQIPYQLLWQDPSVISQHTLIVNATPVGMFPNDHDCPDIPYNQLSHRHMLYDCIYNPAYTLFLRNGAEQGAEIKSGMEMFLKQAELTYGLFLK